MTAPGYPIEIASYCHPSVTRFTAATIRRGVNVRPDWILIGVLPPVARTFTCVPPTSITRIFMALPPATHGLRATRARVYRNGFRHTTPGTEHENCSKELPRVEFHPCP